MNFPRQLSTVRVDYVKNGESRRVLLNKVLTEILKAIRISGLFGSRYYGLHVSRPAICLCSCLVKAGVDLPMVKELMGHKQRAVDTLEQRAQRVPAIFTTAQPTQATSHLQVLDFSSVPR
jgi:hypothetical protein